MKKNINIAIDVMSESSREGSFTIAVRDFAKKHSSINFLLFGNETEINVALNNVDLPNIQVFPTNSVVTKNKDSALKANYVDSSLFGAINALNENQADLFLSAGTIENLIAISLQESAKNNYFEVPCLLLLYNQLAKNHLLTDYYINKSLTSKQLFQLAVLGELYAKAVLQNPEPCVGILNNGVEDTKGFPHLQECSKMLKSAKVLKNYCGFVEPRNIAHCDVIVSDGYSNNMAMSTIEGFGYTLKSTLKHNLLKSKPNLVKPFEEQIKKIPLQIGATSLILGIDLPCLIVNKINNNYDYEFALKNAVQVVQSEFHQQMNLLLEEVEMLYKDKGVQND